MNYQILFQTLLIKMNFIHIKVVVWHIFGRFNFITKYTSYIIWKKINT